MSTVATAIMDPHNSYDSVLAHFRCLLDSFPAHHNLVIFIDGVDRLTDIRTIEVFNSVIITSAREVSYLNLSDVCLSLCLSVSDFA